MLRCKNTIACEACRKRKSKCSGTAPCTACHKNGLRCEFRAERQRRGPRPRAMDLSPLEAEPRAAVELAPVGMSGEGETIVLAMWSSCRDDLRAIVDVDRLRAEMEQSITEDTLLDILCHLLELFWTHVHNQQWPILNPRLLYQHIKARQCPYFLCLAMCAASHRFSSHPALRGVSGSPSLDRLFTSLARQELYQVQHRDVARIQALCILVLYEGAMGRGSQAWADTAFARAAVDVMVNLPSSDPSDSHQIDMARTFLIAQQHLHALGHPFLSLGGPHKGTLASTDCTAGSAAIGLLSILRQVHEYSGSDLCQGSLPPWKSQSTFQLLWRKLETFRLRCPDYVKPPCSLFEEINTPSNVLATAVLSSLEWHCAVLILHRHLLAHMSNYVDASARGPGPSLFSTPSSSFVKEHMKIAIGSAVAVVDICAQIMQCSSFFLAPFLAYTCFQSAVFLINTLRCGLPDSDSKLEQILKINIAMLVMVSDIYAPANAWIQTLEILQNAPTSRNSGSISQIPEPAFIPFDFVQPRSISSEQSTEDQNSSQLPQHPPPSPSQPMGQTHELSLLSDYQRVLDEELDNPFPHSSDQPYAAQSQSLQPPEQPPSTQTSEKQDHREADIPFFNRFSGAQTAPGLTTTPCTPTATIPVPQENQFISSLPAEVLESAFSDPSLGALDYENDVRILDMLLETDTLGSSSLEGVDLDGMQLWSPFWPTSGAG